MSRFTEARYVIVDGEFQRGRPVVRLTSDLVYEVGYLGSGWPLVAREGFSCDLASIPVVPKGLTRLLGRWRWFNGLVAYRQRAADRLARSSIPHDLMRKDLRWPKLLGDYVFWEAMGVDDVPPGERLIAFVCVLLNFSRR